MHPLRKLLILGANHLLSTGAVSLDAHDGSKQKSGHIFADIAGRPSVILWHDIGHEEMRISVWWDYDHAHHPQANKEGNFREQFHTSAPLAKRQHYPKFVGAVASGWLERATGKYLQGEGIKGIFDRYVRRDRASELAELATPTPTGFRAEGRVHM